MIQPFLVEVGWIFQAEFREVPDESLKVPVKEMEVPDRNRKVHEESEDAG